MFCACLDFSQKQQQKKQFLTRQCVNWVGPDSTRGFGSVFVTLPSSRNRNFIIRAPLTNGKIIFLVANTRKRDSAAVCRAGKKKRANLPAMRN
jgi:hypothetical protein